MFILRGLFVIGRHSQTPLWDGDYRPCHAELAAPHPSPTASATSVRNVAIVTVHLRFGFSSIKLLAITAAGPQLDPPGYETNLLYLACLAPLVLGGSGPLSIDGLRASRRQ
jgi:hypothetical protein